MNRNIVEPHSRKYCEDCGELLVEDLVGAEKNIHFYNGEIRCIFASPYDKETGKRNYCYKYTCPKFSWWNPFQNHDSYFVDEIINI